MVNILLSHGIDANILDSQNRNAIHWLSVRQKTPKNDKLSIKQKKLVNTLLDAGCSLQQCDEFGANALHYAAMKGNWPLWLVLNTSRVVVQVKIFHP